MNPTQTPSAILATRGWPATNATLEGLAEEFMARTERAEAALKAIGRIVEDDYTIEETINGRAILHQVRSVVPKIEKEQACSRS